MQLNTKIEEEGHYKGMQYEIRAHSMGHRCGYVIIPKGYGLDNIDFEKEQPLDCHGGITFQDENVIGFDCLHFGDAIDKSLIEEPYKDFFYALSRLIFNGKVWKKEDVRQECFHIIDQLLEISNKKIRGE